MDLTPDTYADVLALLGVIGVALAVLDWRIRAAVNSRTDALAHELRGEINTRTQQIQSGYRNNGESLSDIAHQLRRIEDRLDATGGGK